MSAESNRIEARMRGRAGARELLGTFAVFADHNEARAFWETMRDEALIRAPRDTVASPGETMTDEQSREFEKEIVPFGMLRKMSVAEALIEKPRYMDWLAGLTFIRDLNRYLGSERGKEAMRLAKENDETDFV